MLYYLLLPKKVRAFVKLLGKGTPAKEFIVPWIEMNPEERKAVYLGIRSDNPPKERMDILNALVKLTDESTPEVLARYMQDLKDGTVEDKLKLYEERRIARNS